MSCRNLYFPEQFLRSLFSSHHCSSRTLPLLCCLTSPHNTINDKRYLFIRALSNRSSFADRRRRVDGTKAAHDACMLISHLISAVRLLFAYYDTTSCTQLVITCYQCRMGPHCSHQWSRGRLPQQRVFLPRFPQSHRWGVDI